jgi:hypothetical protein
LLLFLNPFADIVPVVILKVLYFFLLLAHPEAIFRVIFPDGSSPFCQPILHDIIEHAGAEIDGFVEVLLVVRAGCHGHFGVRMIDFDGSYRGFLGWELQCVIEGGEGLLNSAHIDRVAKALQVVGLSLH